MDEATLESRGTSLREAIRRLIQIVAPYAAYLFRNFSTRQCAVCEEAVMTDAVRVTKRRSEVTDPSYKIYRIFTAPGRRRWYIHCEVSGETQLSTMTAGYLQAAGTTRKGG